MLNYLKLFPLIFLLALLVACGGGGIDANTVSAVTKVPFTTAEVSGKTLYLVSVSSSSVVPLAFGATPTDAVDNNGVLNLGGNELTRIQTEKDESGKDTYWLVYDKFENVSRLYLNNDDASEYFNSKSILGGSIQGPGLNLAGTVSKFAGTVGVKGADDKTFYHPLDITAVGTDLYVADYYNHAIRKIDALGNIETFVGTPGIIGSAAGNGAGVGATFYRPSAITNDGKNLYVTDSYNYTIRKINILSKEVTTVAGLARSFGAVDAVKDKARFNVLSGITTDGTNLYVTDAYNTIRKVVISSGAVSTLAGTAGAAGSRDGVGSYARFDLPTGITTDGSFLYVTDFNNRTIRKISIATGRVDTIVGDSKVDPDPLKDTTGIGTKAIFYQLHGITTDGANLYVTDSQKSTVYKINKNTLLVTKLAGITGTRGNADTAVGVLATFDTPTGLTVNGTSLYLVDSWAHTVRKID